MNWKLIFALSLFGVAMAFAAVFGLIQHIEPLLWLVIFIVYAIVIARKTSEKRFLHGFAVSVVNGIWICLIHATFFSTYAANNPEAMAGYAKLPQSISPRMMVLIVGPIIGAVTGLIAGLFAYLAGRWMKKPEQPMPASPGNSA
ncbi:MAG: hypothetical protein HY033_11705 [Ignavibacteriae bacterium]|nr:hypothetical protein [Ignavibacteria bacterium]MBI3365563.1 hypothetical protein [Ignavibacteriota bacterium]